MSATAVELSRVTKRFLSPEPLTALDGVSLSAATGERLVVGGANGSGKSLLMAVIASLETPSSGSVRVQGRVGLVFQDADSQILGETPKEDVAFGPSNLKLPKAEVKKRVTELLRAVGLQEKAECPARSLSGGEKRRLAVAGVLAMDADIIIFDEPYANLDYPGVRQVNALVDQLHGAGKTLLILTHEIEKCLGFADHFVVLAQGKKVFDGTPAEALSQGRAQWERWGMRYPFVSYAKPEDLIWR
ncbi:energy-coupling factor ABC transporter ATP-binding protein [Treponema endosymbiont of Eucomonympha sp.]|uniref:energy-coupling factor ABC transporter ATP-binding protein n=1 Tax=Treponema endosymbiont of Eucomonympha sp. TaxID=1580831 RepID=UPI0007516DF1|nr:ABC transporter ATP-binding protein [Treponema endosymbiont of Eucomonympha sp.]